MNITQNAVGHYILRRKAVGDELRSCIGKIIRVDELAYDGFIGVFVNSWEDVEKPVKFPAAYMEDNGWWDITDLMLEANDTIPPEQDEKTFINDVSMSYRLCLTNLADMELSEEEAIGRRVFRGKSDSAGRVKMHSVAYFAVGFDDAGFIISYYGYGKPCSKMRSPQPIELKILRVRGTAVKLYDADRVIDQCNAEYKQDKAAAGRHMMMARDFATTGGWKKTDNVRTKGLRPQEKVSGLQSMLFT